MRKLQRALLEFKNDASGAVALIVGIALVLVLFGLLSLTVDMGRTQTSYTKGQDATDAAALGTSEFILKGIMDQIGKVPDPFTWQPTPEEIKKYAEQIVRKNFETVQSSAVYDPTSLVVTYFTRQSADGVGIDYVVTVKACADLDTKLGAAAKHQSETRTCTTSDAAFSLNTDSRVEVAFALDFTHSMYCKKNTDCPGFPAYADPFSSSKAGNLVTTINTILDNYFPDDGAFAGNIYASIVPFTGVVNLYPYNATMVREQTSPFNIPKTDSFATFDLGDYGFSQDFTAPTRTKRFANYDNNFDYVLERFPVIDSSAKFSQIIADGSDPNSFLPLESFRATLDNVDQSGTPQPAADTRSYKYGLCYSGIVNAGLDQRIEKEIRANGNTAGGQIGVNGEIIPKNLTEDGNPANNNFVTASVFETPFNSVDAAWAFNPSPSWVRNTLYGHNNTTGPYIELHEAFPIQPLTNKRELLRNVVNRFTSNGSGQRLFSASYSEPVFDNQSSRINKSYHFTSAFGTSSWQGLLWAWLTLNNNLAEKWREYASVHENYNGALGVESKESRDDVPSSENLKYIILITDGNDNDGAILNDGYTRQCDSYVPKEAVSNNQYNGLCNRIKGDDVKIHTILYDFTPPTGVNKHELCASEGGYHPNVRPDELNDILDNIFREIITNLVTVRLVK